MLQLNFLRKVEHLLPVRNPSPLAIQEALNHSWSVDFMHGSLVCGRHFQMFNVVDGFKCEALSIEIDLNLPNLRMLRVLEKSAAIPAIRLLRMDNGLTV